MRLNSETDILDESTRARIIEEIKGSENKQRRDEMYKRYDIYKDNTQRYVVAKMLKMFDLATVEEMSYAISNVSLERKIVDKLARVYSLGCKREVLGADGKESEDLTKQVEELSKLLCMNTKMKKTNRSYKRDKNALAYVKPIKVIEGNEEKFDLEVCPTLPFLYDVVEDPDNREKPMVVIMSPYAPPATYVGLPVQTDQQAGFHANRSSLKMGDGKDQGIADEPGDQNAQKNEYIWWSKSYHFTTNEKGQITSPDGIENELGELPFVNFAEDQDGAYWAKGGEDLVEGSIMLNSLISHMNHIAVTQGYGQFYMSGKNLPKSIKIGPSHGIRIEVETDDPTPQVGFLEANPPLSELKANIEMYLALMLTTNNLSVSGVATQLGNSSAPAAGISLIIDKAESMEDVSDQQQIFHDNEKVIWKMIAKWMNLLKSRGLLASRLQEFALPEDINVALKFPEPRPIMTEKEKLENLKAREELGLNSHVELLMMDDPQLTTEAAEEKLKKILEEKMQKMASSMEMMNGQDDNGNSGGDGVGQQDDVDSKAGSNGGSKKPASFN